MIRLLTLLTFLTMTVQAQEASKLCPAGSSDPTCTPVGNQIDNGIISTTDMLRVFGRISSTAPIVSGAMVYKTNQGLVQTASNTYVSNTGTANEALIAINVNTNVLNASVLKLVSPSSLPTCNTAATGNIALSGSKVCVCDGTKYNNLLGGTNLVTGLLTGTCP